ncbi:MAG: RagB/SusD family nutrient uptake outer membrane protein [Cytophagaceae bacterium]|nr:RagB/SusD family nutrient uptake outer membrane protein [Gemmatimonadaceae bacterium]
MTWPRLTRIATLATLALGVASCQPSEILDITDPDIVNPGDVQSPAGANAVRLGALSRFNGATTGFCAGTAATCNASSTNSTESILMLGGLFADEWNNGDSFIARQEVDQRVITPQNNFLTDANRALHRARLSAEQAIGLLTEFNPTGPGWQVAEMLFVQAYVENILAEHLCNGLTFSTVVDGIEQYGTPLTVTAAFQQALTHADAGLAKVTGTTAADLRVKYALQILRGRILLNLNRPADAATAVAGVPTSFKYDMLHSATTNSNAFWSFNNLNRRYSVSTGEGTNGINFATANDPRVPVCMGGDAACRAIGVTRSDRDDLTRPFYVQTMWAVVDAPVSIFIGAEARMIEAEAQLRAGNSAGALATINAARATVTGLAPLTDAGTADARIDQLFRERAFWLFGKGTRVGDLRRLVRQYTRPAASVFPVGAWHKGGNYGGDTTIPVPLAESNNPNVPSANTCTDRNS